MRSKLTRLVISTDDDEIAAYGENVGVEVVRRPPELAEDDSPTLPVVTHVMGQLKWPGDSVMLLQPTNPLRTTEDIDAALAILDMAPKVKSVMSVTSVGECHPARMYEIMGSWASRLPYYSDERRQLLPPLYLRDGSIYLARHCLLQSGELIGKPVPLMIPRERSLRIDEPFDLALAEFMLTVRGGQVR